MSRLNGDEHVSNRRYAIFILRLLLDEHSQLVQGELVDAESNVHNRFRDWQRLTATIQSRLFTQDQRSSRGSSETLTMQGGAMNAEVMKPFDELPKADSCRQIDFDQVEIFPSSGNPAEYILFVSGKKPYRNMQVDLVPMVYIQQPDYWKIEVVGCIQGMGLPVEGPYNAFLPLTGIIGSKGIEVIGANGSEKQNIPLQRTEQFHEWTAWYDRMPSGAVLHVQGICQFPTGGYSVELKRHVPQGNSQELLLDKLVHEPTWPVTTAVTTVEAKYREETQQEYITVTLLPDDVSIPVKVTR